MKNTTYERIIIIIDDNTKPNYHSNILQFKSA